MVKPRVIAGATRLLHLPGLVLRARRHYAWFHGAMTSLIKPNHQHDQADEAPDQKAQHFQQAVEAVSIAAHSTLVIASLRHGVMESLRKTCWATNTAASRWTPVSASKPTTALRWSGCCAIALLRASTVFHGAPTQRGKQTGVPLCQTAQRAHQ